MAILRNTRVTLIDSAVGPVSIQESDTDTDSYDIDDFVHDMAVSQALTLQLYTKSLSTDDELAAGRFPVTVGGVIVGGV